MLKKISNIPHTPFALLFFGVGIILSITFACKNKSYSDNSQSVFRLNLSSTLTSLDPASASQQSNIWMCAQIFNGLVEFDDSLKVRPSLARKYTISNDGKIYTFNLRNNVYFHSHVLPDGKKFRRKLTASDVVFSFTRICDPKTASPGQWIFNDRIAGIKAFQSGKIDYITGFRAVNDSTFEVELQTPFPPFISLLAMPYGFIVPKEVVEFYGKDFRLHPVGTGPYVFRYWTEGRQLVLHKNPDYFEVGLPKTDALCASFISNRLTAFMELQNGNLDFIEGIDPLLRDELLTDAGTLKPEKSKYFDLFLLPQLTTEYWGINMRKGSGLLAENKNLRLAINYAIDRRKLTTHLLRGLALPALAGIVPQGMPSFSEDLNGYDYQPEKVKEYLSLAGFPEGKGLPELTLHTTPAHSQTAEMLQHDLNQFGIRLKVETVEGATLRELIAKGQVHLFRASWIADYPDAENYLSLFLTANHSPKGPNTTHFTDADVDATVAKALTLQKDDDRFVLYRQAEKRMLEQSPVVPLYYYRTVRLVKKGWKHLPVCAMPTVFPLKKVERVK